MQNLRKILPVCAAALYAISLPNGPANGQSPTAKADKDRQFVRVLKNADKLQSLQTAITRYRSTTDKSVSVDLISAVHIGEGLYYDTLNELFKDYDVVLYELVAPEGTRIPRGGGGGQASNPISMMQVTARQFLGLESQLERVDYTPENLKHADLSPSQMAAKMQERGESAFSLAASAFGEMMARANTADQSSVGNVTLSDIADMMSDPLKAKRFMATQMGSMGNLESGLGEKVSRLIVDDRNEAAMGVFDETLKDGNQNIAIFYGAAHMPDFEERLAKRGFEFQSESWLDAWDLTQSHASRDQQHPMSLLMQLMKELDN